MLKAVIIDNAATILMTAGGENEADCLESVAEYIHNTIGTDNFRHHVDDLTITIDMAKGDE